MSPSEQDVVSVEFTEVEWLRWFGMARRKRN